MITLAYHGSASAIWLDPENESRPLSGAFCCPVTSGTDAPCCPRHWRARPPAPARKRSHRISGRPVWDRLFFRRVLARLQNPDHDHRPSVFPTGTDWMAVAAEQNGCADSALTPRMVKSNGNLLTPSASLDSQPIRRSRGQPTVHWAGFTESHTVALVRPAISDPARAKEVFVLGLA